MDTLTELLKKSLKEAKNDQKIGQYSKILEAVFSIAVHSTYDCLSFRWNASNWTQWCNLANNKLEGAAYIVELTFDGPSLRISGEECVLGAWSVSPSFPNGHFMFTLSEECRLGPENVVKLPDDVVSRVIIEAGRRAYDESNRKPSAALAPRTGQTSPQLPWLANVLERVQEVTQKPLWASVILFAAVILGMILGAWAWSSRATPFPTLPVDQSDQIEFERQVKSGDAEVKLVMQYKWTLTPERVFFWDRQRETWVNTESFGKRK
jgi:hypothetical protein